MNKKNITKKSLKLASVLLIISFILSCNPPNYPEPPPPKPTVPNNQLYSPAYTKPTKRKSYRSSRRSSSRRSSSSSSSSSTSTTSTTDDETPNEQNQNDISRLSEISNLMARGEYEKAAEISRGISPELSRLIESGDYTNASLLLSQMVAQF